ncbi:MAG: hypothetical protein K9M80_08435, partial [Candidatus Marinimicrobia bacterium]|nr:hypothetical protein [Candidatus Neomarinimicrobiota bacterium]
EISVTSSSDTNKVLTYQSKPFKINIISVLPPNAQKEKDIKAPFPIRTIIPWELIGFALLFILLSAGLYISLKKWKQKRKMAQRIKEEYLKPPHTIAISKLQQLRKNTNFGSRQSLKEFYFKLSEILREYLERRFFIYALEMSTSEIITASRKFDLDNELKEDLENILRDIDFIKYANQPSRRKKALQHWENIYKWIQATQHDPFFSTRSGLTETVEEIQIKKSE